MRDSILEILKNSDKALSVYEIYRATKLSDKY